MFDRVLAALVLILLAALFAAIALTIKLVDPGPVFLPSKPGWAGTGKPSAVEVPHHGGGRGSPQG